MKKNSLLICFTFLSCMMFGQKAPAEYYNFVNRADSLFWKKEYHKSALTYSSAFKTLGGKGTERDRYEAAQAWAMANIPDSAFVCLQKITSILYYADFFEITNEEALDNLHTDKRWMPLLKQVKKNQLPSGWDRKESKPLTYRIYIEDSAGQNHGNAATIKSIVSKTGGFGNLMQTFAAGRYKGKRIRMTGYMKAKDVFDWAGFWLRVDDSSKNKQLTFDNMHDGYKDRSITGTTGWKKYEIVLDVPEEAAHIAFGALLTGTGQIWFEKINFDIVDKSIPTTARPADEPNLDFSK